MSPKLDFQAWIRTLDSLGEALLYSLTSSQN